MTIKTPLLALLACSALPAIAQATDAKNSVLDRPKEGDQIIVSASRFPQAISSVLAPVDVVTRDDMERWQSTTLYDVLRRLPGVDLAQNGGQGQLSSIFIRGTESRHTLVLIDGVRLNQAGISGSTDFSQIPVSMIQRIEYIRGARSAAYGSDAIGGVINVITRRDQDGGMINITGGSHGYQSYNGAVQQSVGDRTTLSAAVDYTHVNGYDVVANLPDPWGPPAQPDKDGFQNKSLLLGVEHQFNDNVAFFASARGYHTLTDYDGFSDRRKLYEQNYDLGLRFKEGRYSSEFVSSYTRTKDENFTKSMGQHAPGSTHDDAEQYSLRWGNSVTVGNGTVSAGLDWQKQYTTAGTGFVDDARSLDNMGIYLTAQQQFNLLTLEASARGDHHSAFGWHGTWQAGAALALTENYRFITLLGTAFKAPTLGQLYGSFGGNDALKPEESMQYEAGFEGDTLGINWRVTTYRNQIDNLINTIYDPSNNVSTNENINKATIKGAELTAQFDTGLLQHNLSYQIMNARNDQTGQLLDRRAKQQFKYQLDWQVWDLDWALSYQYLGHRFDTDFNTNQRIKMGGVSLWDIAVSYPITQHLTVRGRIANLLGKDYETVYGYKTPGREFFFTGSYSF